MSATEPLWLLMRNSHEDSPGFPDAENRCYAAEIRAVANWLESRSSDSLACESGEVPVIVWRIVGLLLAEADQAEAGE